jgi:hypothetical protein
MLTNQAHGLMGHTGFDPGPSTVLVRTTGVQESEAATPNFMKLQAGWSLGRFC